MSDNRSMNEYYQQIAKELIDVRPELEAIRESDVQIVLLSSDHKPKKGGKLVFGQCEKIANKYKWAIPADFTITVFDPNCDDFTEEQLSILIFHELLHVGVELGDDGEWKYSIIPHDLEDFKAIVDEYGTSWAES
jgi:hypothetical protein